MADEWFRSPAWDVAGQAEFERRLGRARRTSRGQYLRIKGLALNVAGQVDAARSLWLRVLADPGFELERWSTLEHLADLDFDTHPIEAEARYRQLLTEDPSLNATTGMAEVRLAELLIRQESDASLKDAGDLLDAWQANRHSPFPANHFHWQLVRARWGEAAGNAEITREAATRAIELSQARSPFPRHPTFGVVQSDAQVMTWLQARAKA